MFSQNPDRCTKEFMTESCKFFELISDDTYDVSDVQIINDYCLYVTYKKSKDFQTPALNTNVIIASYITTYARLEVYSYLKLLEDRALYYDTDYIIYRYVVDMYNPPLSEFEGVMADELGGSCITEYVSNGPKTYAYRMYRRRYTGGQCQRFHIKLCGLSAVAL